MIVEFKENQINNIAKAHLSAWKKGFEGILSKKMLSNLTIESFESNWRKILAEKERNNFIWLNEFKEGLGFISYGKPKDKNEIADFEIYGIYVHPKHWKKGIGYELMNYAINSIKQLNPSSKIVLWTLDKNKISQKFYSRFGFNQNEKRRMSSRKNETFEEVQFEM